MVSAVGKKRQAREIGFYLFIASLAMFFAALLLSYVIKKHVLDNQPSVRPDLPWLLAPSTVLLFTGSFMLQRAIGFIRREKTRAFLFSLKCAFGCAMGFCLLQTIAMAQMLVVHVASPAGFVSVSEVSQDVASAVPQDAGQVVKSRSYALILLMILVHVLHFVGGVTHLGFVTHWAHQGHYDHESYQQVYFAGWYWRFLDMIWVLMLMVFYLG